MMEVECFHHFTKGAPYKQPHVLWLDVELSSPCRFPLPHQAMRNGAITPIEGLLMQQERLAESEDMQALAESARKRIMEYLVTASFFKEPLKAL
jgi:hypothetical protein